MKSLSANLRGLGDSSDKGGSPGGFIGILTRCSRTCMPPTYRPSVPGVMAHSAVSLDPFLPKTDMTKGPHEVVSEKIECNAPFPDLSIVRSPVKLTPIERSFPATSLRTHFGIPHTPFLTGAQ